jgi:putative toxin-antitoxin system antitoxin component (TIGR02293 family)
MNSDVTRILFEGPREIIQRTRQGFPVVALHDAASVLGTSAWQLCDALRIRKRMALLRKDSLTLLTSDESDRLLRVLKTLNRSVEVLGDKDSGRCWLCSKVRSLGGVRPLDLLDTGSGYCLVMDTLGRIEQGISA